MLKELFGISLNCRSSPNLLLQLHTGVDPSCSLEALHLQLPELRPIPVSMLGTVISGVLICSHDFVHEFVHDAIRQALAAGHPHQIWQIIRQSAGRGPEPRNCEVLHSICFEGREQGIEDESEEQEGRHVALVWPLERT